MTRWVSEKLEYNVDDLCCHCRERTGFRKNVAALATGGEANGNSIWRRDINDDASNLITNDRK
ncbi:MAG: hypothetical protein CMJ62_09105 [Planctomycetaceae bacterium]|nr:hypothetical protein [Planctomycetaceae bacterium]